jgi:Na+/H+ antiporter NhaC
LVVETSEREGFAVVAATLDGGEPVSADHRVGNGLSVVPPLFAILVALFFRKVLIAMLSAIFLGALLHFEGNPVADLADGARYYIWGNIADEFYYQILFFTFALVGMVIVSTKAGGSQGLIDLIARIANTAKSTRIATFVMGLVIFFDDYANTIVVGTTVRPMSDKRRISREKLAYLVDSTAAPVAGLAVISTWIAFEVSLLQSLIDQIHLVAPAGESMGGYALFIAMLPLRFYCIITLAFVLIGAWTGRDYGPMLKAERRAARTGEVLAPNARPLTSRAMSEILPEPGTPARWINAVLPIVVLMGAVVIGMLLSGKEAVLEAGFEFSVLSFDTWRSAFGAADSARVLLIAALLSSVVAIGMVVAQRILGFFEAIRAWLRGVPAMALAVSILICAWAIRSVCDDLGTSTFLVAAVGDGIPTFVFPLFVFLISAGIAFATGTSWGTMGILLPVVLPWAWSLSQAPDVGFWIVLVSAAAVLDGAITGDHCSPISDTTIMSSLATSCDHIDHVRTQLPYAMTCMAIACGAYLAVAARVGTLLIYAGALLAIVAIFRLIGRPIIPPGEEDSFARVDDEPVAG